MKEKLAPIKIEPDSWLDLVGCDYTAKRTRALFEGAALIRVPVERTVKFAGLPRGTPKRKWIAGARGAHTVTCFGFEASRFPRVCNRTLRHGLRFSSNVDHRVPVSGGPRSCEICGSAVRNAKREHMAGAKGGGARTAARRVWDNETREARKEHGSPVLSNWKCDGNNSEIADRQPVASGAIREALSVPQPSVGAVGPDRTRAAQFTRYPKTCLRWFRAKKHPTFPKKKTI
ncbi:hypothetical protein EDB83DRAFT_2550512 [Lactarius deliciosus]|nr:hypothetical protein EDB83DRAFT_2550512 [Lactarius deliciosus]